MKPEQMLSACRLFFPSWIFFQNSQPGQLNFRRGLLATAAQQSGNRVLQGVQAPSRKLHFAIFEISKIRQCVARASIRSQ